MEQREFGPVYLLPVKVTITNAGVVTVEKKQTDADHKFVVGYAISYDDTTNLPGSKINIKLGGKSLHRYSIETALFTFNSSCPVNQRYYNYIDEMKVDSSEIEIIYEPGASFPAGDTTVTVFLQCTK